jgi:hypothetical protein
MIPVPEQILESKVTICRDIMFVSKISFLVTISRNIKFTTTEMLINRKASTVLNSMKKIIQIYNMRGLLTTFAIMDIEFEPIRGELADQQVALNCTARDEHVGDIERHIRTIKKRCRCIYNTPPFTHIPTRLVIEMVFTTIFWLNSFPLSDRVANEKINPEDNCHSK